MNYEIICTRRLNLINKMALIKIYTTVFIKIPVILATDDKF
jgi:hypothetical protein